MHTFIGKHVNIHYTGDFQGKVILRAHKTQTETEIPIQDLKDFIATFVRYEKIKALEDASTNQILGIV